MMAIRLSTEDRQLLNALVERRSEELASTGVEVSAASIIRGLIRQAANDLGIAKASTRPKRS